MKKPEGKIMALENEWNKRIRKKEKYLTLAAEWIHICCQFVTVICIWWCRLSKMTLSLMYVGDCRFYVCVYVFHHLYILI